MLQNEIKAILFDFGETLLTFGKVNVGQLFAEGAALSYDFLENAGQPVGNFRYYCWRNLISLRLNHLYSAITGNDFNALELLKKLNAKNGIGLNEQQWQQFVWLWYEPLSRFGKAESQIKETLAKLKDLGIKLGIISNTFVNGFCLEKHLQQFGILEFFSAKLYSYEFDFRKPDARIFKAAAEKIGEKLENIVFVGDRIDNDIIPAVKLGMRTVCKKAYTNIGRKIPAGVWQINQLSELPALVKEINAN